MRQSQLISLGLVTPALLILLALFVYPLGFSLVTAFVDETGAWTFGNFSKAMRGRADQIVVVSRFKFTRDDVLETKLTSR